MSIYIIYKLQKKFETNVNFKNERIKWTERMFKKKKFKQISKENDNIKKKFNIGNKNKKRQRNHLFEDSVDDEIQYVET